MNTLYEDEKQTTDLKPVSNLIFWGLLLFFLFEYIRPGSYLPIPGKLNTIIPLFVFLATFISKDGRSNLTILNASNTKWLLFYILLFPIQAFTADVTYYVFLTFKKIVGYFLIYFVIIKQVTSLRRINAIFSTLIFLHFLMIVLNPDIVLSPESRSYLFGMTFLGDGNDFAWSVCIIVPFSLYLLQTSESKLKRLIYMFALFSLILAIIGTQSRGGSLALGASIIYIFIKTEKKAIGIIVLGALIVMIFLFAPQVYFDRMKSIANYETEGSAQGRIQAWKSAIRMAVDHPFVGVGAGHFPVKYGEEYRPPGVARTAIPWHNAHSIYFLALAEFGFTGIFFLLGFILFNFFRNERYMREIKAMHPLGEETYCRLAIAMQASLIGFAIAGTFLSGLNYPHLYVIAALCEATGFIIRTLPVPSSAASF